VRHLLPAHYSNAGAEQVDAELRSMFEQRSFACATSDAPILLHGPARLHLNNRDDINVYHLILREVAQAGAGRPASHQRSSRDPRGVASLR
jgi:hypothetical protein